MKKMFMVLVILLIILIAIGAVISLVLQLYKTNTPSSGGNSQSRQVSPNTEKVLADPISNAKSRIIKKPFGIYVTPENSPVQPEKFTGYHTGADFETTPQEANANVPIYAVCSGSVRIEETVQGYGGVIIENCVLENQPVTVLYGHLNINTFHTLSGEQNVKAGDKIAVLAPANSAMSGGERKHLHLGIHKGSAVDFRGYVQNKSELYAWIDPATLL